MRRKDIPVSRIPPRSRLLHRPSEVLELPSNQTIIAGSVWRRPILLMLILVLLCLIIEDDDLLLLIDFVPQTVAYLRVFNGTDHGSDAFVVLETHRRCRLVVVLMGTAAAPRLF